MNLEINHHLLRADIRATSAQIVGIKRLLRAPWLRPMAEPQRELCKLKRRATELYALHAFTRGKLHVQQPPRGAASEADVFDYHRRIADRLGPSYATTLEKSA